MVRLRASATWSTTKKSTDIPWTPMVALASPADSDTAPRLASAPPLTSTASSVMVWRAGTSRGYTPGDAPRLGSNSPSHYGQHMAKCSTCGRSIPQSDIRDSAGRVTKCRRCRRRGGSISTQNKPPVTEAGRAGVVTCPTTGKGVATGFDVPASSLGPGNTFACSACGAAHTLVNRGGKAVAV